MASVRPGRPQGLQGAGPLRQLTHLYRYFDRLQVPASIQGELATDPEELDQVPRSSVDGSASRRCSALFASLTAVPRVPRFRGDHGPHELV